MRGRTATPLCGLMALLAACAILGSADARAAVPHIAAPRARVAEVPRLPIRARFDGPVRSAQAIALTVSLAGRDPLGLQALATAVSTPGSPVFRHYLGVAAFAARFGAAPSAVARVSAALRRSGLHVDPVERNHLTIGVSGSAAVVERAFATRLDRVRLVGGRVAYAPRTTPTLPGPLAADVDGVIGLDSLARPQALGPPARPVRPGETLAPAARGRVATGGPQPCAAALAYQAAEVGATGFGGYTADTIAAAYGFPTLYAGGVSGAGQTVALYELETVHTRDLAAYQACYGTHVPVSIHDIGHPRRTRTDEESALDAEQIIGLAPGARLAIYQAPDSAADGLRLYSRIVSDDTARTISTSWGACESKLTDGGRILTLVRDENRLFQEAAVQGQTVVAASGDTGSAGCYGMDRSDRSIQAQDPASQPFATGVGGTSLYTVTSAGLSPWNPDVPGEPAPIQAVWNEGVDHSTGVAIASATSGGISRLWTMPAYQRHARHRLHVVAADSSGRPCRTRGYCREVPDVSADGDPDTGYLVYVSGPTLHDPRGSVPQWVIEGGTSAAAPLWAALTALADSSTACRGTTIGFENPSLYRLATRPGVLGDVTLANPFTHFANNDPFSRHGPFPVTAGYDMTTGLGTPNAAAVAAGLCGLRAPVYAVALAAPRTRRTALDDAVRLRVTGHDSGRLALRYRAHGLPRGLSISRHGVITGRPRRLGRYVVRVSAVDHATNRGAVAFVLRVVPQRPRLTRVTLAGVARRRPVLGLSLTRGRGAADPRTVTLRLPRGLSFGRRAGGVRVRDGRRRVPVSVRRRHGALTITLDRAEPTVRITIGPGTLFADGAIARTARRRPMTRVRVQIHVVDRRHRGADAAPRLRLR